MNYSCYLDLAALKSSLAITDTTDDTRLLDILQDVSGFINNHCGQPFYVLSATRTFTAARSDRLLLPYPLLSITSLKHDDDDDWDYDYTWAATDYHLSPFNEFPKWRVLTKSGGDYSFPSQEEGVQIAGLWGYGDGESATPYASDTTTAEELDASETAVDVTSATNIQAGHTILVESEQMFVQSKATNTLTVVRGVNGTTAATHATAKTISIYRYPRNIRRAALMLAEQTYRVEDAPLGVSGSAEMAYETLNPQQQRLILHWMAPFRNLAVS